MLTFFLNEKWRLPIMGLALFFSYLSVALPLPVLSMHVTSSFDYANWLGGLAVGGAFISTLLSRPYAGTFSDRWGGKKCTIWGLTLYALAAIVCLFSASEFLPNNVAYGVLLLGRFILGIGESFTLVGIISWNVSLMGAQHSGKVMAIVGMAIYGAFAMGGPMGVAISEKTGFTGLMVVSILLPAIGYFMLQGFPNVVLEGNKKGSVSFFKVLSKIWDLGMVVGLQGVGFAVLSAFISLYFYSYGWSYAGFGLTFFGFGFVAVRMLFSNLPDKVGGIPVAIVSLIIEAVGQFVLWTAPNLYVAFIGALLTGIGCSMVYPAIGVEVVRRVPAELRGVALGGFAAFQDVAYAFSAPVAGLFADYFGYSVVFLIGAISATLGIMLAFSIQKTSVEK